MLMMQSPDEFLHNLNSYQPVYFPQSISKAPIALFVYNRPWHTKQTIEALQKNTFASESDLFIFSDAARIPATVSTVQEVREYINGITGFKSIKIHERQENLGLANSIIDGVTRICDEYGRVIVLEDDLVTSPYFLKFMNNALDLYEAEESVISIHGYNYPIKADLPETFFLRGADCWGWATWKRGWDLFESDGRSLLKELESRKLTRDFDFEGSYPFTKMLKDQIKGKNNSWAIRWYASAFLQNKLTLYPGLSLVHNIGTDGSGIHCSTRSDFAGSIADFPIEALPIIFEESCYARQRIALFHKKSQSDIVTQVLRKLADMTSWIKKLCMPKE